MSDRVDFSARELAVSVRNLRKVYRLYQRPLYKFLDLLELCPPGPAYYTEHEALADVTLDIARGEKVAIIGRNGAGKSTLLKMIAGIARPSAGRVAVNGRISNLLQIGSGFHPDFTGRQNVFAGLAHQGIVGREASRLFDDIVAFAEVEEYIDQPMKTYSTGMCSRLMFSSSVLLVPDILIVDEILGVGDAYFSHKSFKRMRDLCADAGTTLLLVTHDLNSALNLCDRFVWIDRGRIWFEGDGKEAVARYESSVKEQEEQALRQRKVASFRSAPEPTPSPPSTDLAGPAILPPGESASETTVHVIFRSRTGFVLSHPLGLSEIDLTSADGRSLTLKVADGAERWYLMEESNLGEVEVVGGRRSRPLGTFGSIYHKTEWAVRLPPGFDVKGLRALCHYQGDDPIDIRVIRTDRTVLVRGELEAAPGWQEVTLAATDVGHTESDVVKQVDYGSGAIRITSVEFLDATGQPVSQVAYGEALTVRVHCRRTGAAAESAVTFFVGFARQGFTHQAYIYDERLRIPTSAEFTIDSRLDEVRLGSGIWFVNVGLGAPEIFRREEVPHFSIDEAYYHLSSSRIEFRVLSVTRFDSGGCFYAMPAAIVATESNQPPRSSSSVT